MSESNPRDSSSSRELPKAATGIRGLDEISGGGLPRGRPTLVCGSAGCGKTLLATEFLVRGAVEMGEPGVFVSFEETAAELTQNVRSLGFDLDELEAAGKILVEAIHIERSEIEETGEYDLEGLFIRIGLAIDSIGAQRIVLDTIENLFGGLSNDAILRSELRRLFRWLKDRGMTTVITGERGDGQLTRHGLEEYVADCVILLDHRVNGQLSTRRLRIVKYRGTVHGTNEYPFLIDETGISVLPVTSMGLDHAASAERISTGVPRLDAMLGGRGYYRGSSIMVTGTAGTGKTSLGASFVDAACARGERCLYLSFEESAHQIVRNMRSIGIDLEPWIEQGLLRIESARPSLHGLESHLVAIHKLVHESRPRVVVIDPLSSFNAAGAEAEVQAMLLRLIDFLKSEGITAFLVSLTSGGGALERSEVEISSLIDTWLLLRDIEAGGERNRGLYVLKSRGMNHSNQIREFRLTDRGIDLLDVYVGSEGVLTGSLRAAQEAREQTGEATRKRETERRQRELERRRVTLEAQIAALRADAEAVDEEARRIALEDHEAEQIADGYRQRMAHRRGADREAAGPKPTGTSPSNGPEASLQDEVS
ncbi:MAG TPA: circadian clock protein KaiC [Thermoanaerobaculia bacterium]|jgi:circadian clock protein KaiC|nr:circadian clock protein KaiC [Thermoanaerobaculia bacterium]